MRRLGLAVFCCVVTASGCARIRHWLRMDPEPQKQPEPYVSPVNRENPDDPPPKPIELAVDPQQKPDVRVEHAHWVVGISWSPGGKFFASGGWDGRLLVWDPKAHAVSRKIENREMGKVMNVAAADDLIAAGTTSLDVWIWRPDGSLVTKLPIRSAINGVAFSPGGMLAVASEGGFHFWQDPLRGGPRVLPGACLSVAFSPGGELVAGAFRDGSVKVYRTEEWAFERALQGEVNLMKSLAFGPDGNHLAAGTNGGVLVWKLEPQGRRDFKDRAVGWVESVGFTPDMRYVVTCLADHYLRFWDLTTGTVAVTLQHTGGAKCLAADPQGKGLVSGGPKDVQFWRLNCTPVDRPHRVAKPRPVEPTPGDGSGDPQTVEESLAKAQKLIDEGDGDGAMKALDAVLAKYPRNLELLRYRLFVCERRLALRDAYDTACAIAAAEGDPLSERERAQLVDKYAEMYLEEARRASDSLYSKKGDILAMLDAALALKPGAELERRIKGYRDEVAARPER